MWESFAEEVFPAFSLRFKPFWTDKAFKRTKQTDWKEKMAEDERAVVVTTTNIIKYINNSCLHLGGFVFNLIHYELCVC